MGINYEMSRQDQACLLAENGFKVFPITPRSKKPPIFEGWQEKASTDGDQVFTWWEKHKDANIGIYTSGLVVVDVDMKQEAQEWNEKYKERLKETSFVVKTPSGGLHYYFRQDPFRKPIPSSVSKVCKGVDIRAEGGYVVAPPSVTDVGAYEYVYGVYLETASDLPIVPDWLQNALDALLDKPQGHFFNGEELYFEDGSRWDGMRRLAMKLRSIGMSGASIEEALLAFRNNQVENPSTFKISEIKKIASDVAKHEPKENETILLNEVSLSIDKKININVGSVFTEKPAEDRTPCPQMNEDIYSMVKGSLIGDLMDFFLESSAVENRVASFMTAIGMMSFLCGRNIFTYSGLGLNIMGFVLGSSGSGKSDPRSKAMRIIREAGFDHLIIDSIASSEGLEDAILQNRKVFFYKDEADPLVRAANFDTGPLSNFVSDINKIYSESSIGSYHRIRHSSKKGRKKDAEEIPMVVESPLLVFLGNTTKDLFFEILGNKTARDGFLARCIILPPETGRKEKNLISELRYVQVPVDILGRVSSWLNWKPQYSRGYTVELSKEVRDLAARADSKGDAINALQGRNSKKWEEGERAGDPIMTSIYSRVSENAYKLAYLHHCSLFGIPTEIDGELYFGAHTGLGAVGEVPYEVQEVSLKWGYMVAEASAEYVLWNLKREGPGVDNDEKIRQKIMSKLEILGANKEPVSQSELLRKTRIGSEKLKLHMKTLEDRGEIEVFTGELSKNGKRTIFYRIK